jgi:hypothetical protein
MSKLIWLLAGVAGAFFSTTAFGFWGLLGFAVLFLWMSKPVIEDF